MNTRFKIICLLFGIAYFYFVGTVIVDEIPVAIASFKEGMANARKQYDEKSNNGFSENETETLYFKVKPISGFYSFPSSVTNLKAGNLVQTELSYFMAKVNKAQLSLHLKIGYGILLFLAFPTLFAILFIPLQTYRVIRSVVKNEIFNPKNINRIRWIGYCLLFIFSVEIYANFIYTAKAQVLIQLEDYRIIFKMGEEYYWLLFALVTLMFAEILKYSHTLKEEQDLTI